MPELNSEAIDFRVASECFAPVRKLTRHELHSLHLTTLQQGREVATVGGVLLFGLDRLEHFPEAYLRAGCFKGEDKSVIIDSTNITDFPVLAVVWDFILVSPAQAVGLDWIAAKGGLVLIVRRDFSGPENGCNGML